MGDNINVLALVPIVSADMMQFSIVYRAATLEIIGTTIDTTGNSEESRQRQPKSCGIWNAGVFPYRDRSLTKNIPMGA